MVEDNHYTYFSVRKSKSEWLDVVFANKGCVIVHVVHGNEYLARDASTSPIVSGKKIYLDVDGQSTPFSVSLKLTKRQALDIIHLFCTTGRLSEGVLWIPEGRNEKGDIQDYR